MAPKEGRESARHQSLYPPFAQAEDLRHARGGAVWNGREEPDPYRGYRHAGVKAWRRRRSALEQGPRDHFPLNVTTKVLPRRWACPGDPVRALITFQQNRERGLSWCMSRGGQAVRAHRTCPGKAGRGRPGLDRKNAQGPDGEGAGRERGKPDDPQVWFCLHSGLHPPQH